MSFSRILFAAIVLAAIAPHPARAETLVSVRPGVACTSADALARLTRPDGSSRSMLPHATADAREIARSGGCFPFGPGMTVFPHSIRRQTSIVTADALDRGGPLTLYVANIDFVPVAGPGAVPGGRDAGPVELHPSSPQSPVARPPPAWIAPATQAPAVAAEPSATGRTLSTGLLSLGMTARDARRRLAGFSVLDRGESGGDDAFVAETWDHRERYEVHSRGGTVVLVMHGMRFRRGRQQVLSVLVDRLLALYGAGPTVVSLPGAAAGAGVPVMPPQPGWERDWIDRPVVMAPRDSVAEATGGAADLGSCAQRLARLVPADAGDDGQGVVPAGPGADMSSCGRQVLVRLEPGTIPTVAGRLLVVLAD